MTVPSVLKLTDEERVNAFFRIRALDIRDPGDAYNAPDPIITPAPDPNIELFSQDASSLPDKYNDILDSLKAKEIAAAAAIAKAEAASELEKEKAASELALEKAASELALEKAASQLALEKAKADTAKAEAAAEKAKAAYAFASALVVQLCFRFFCFSQLLSSLS